MDDTRMNGDFIVRTYREAKFCHILYSNHLIILPPVVESVRRPAEKFLVRIILRRRPQLTSANHIRRVFSGFVKYHRVYKNHP